MATLKELREARLHKLDQLKNLGIDFNELINEQEKELANSGIEDKLRLMFRDKI